MQAMSHQTHNTPVPVEAVSLNTLDPTAVSALDQDTQLLIERRRKVMGPAYRLAYAEPLQPKSASGTKIIDVYGDEYLDAYNNVASVGHNHPRVVDAVTRQLALINTNTRYLQSDIVDYAEDLVSTHGPQLTNVMFTCTGSEANDLGLRIARHVTGGTGVIVSSYAYHGCTRDVAAWSPASGTGAALGPEVRVVPPPDTFRAGRDALPQTFAAHVQEQIDDLRRHGVQLAALVVDSLFSSDGIYCDPDVLVEAAEVVHKAGGLVVSDEVQSGFGRTGSAMWGHQRSQLDADIATMGKPMGNGMPIGGVVAKRSLIDQFGTAIPYFNTFGGENAPIAAAQAVLDIIRDEDLIANAADKGAQLGTGMREILGGVGCASDVRGAGMYLGVEFVDDLQTKAPDPRTAEAVVSGLRRRRVLISIAGPYGNVLKVRPPLVFSQSDVDRFLAEFETVVTEVIAQ
jgi:4-aminobutyrate aminotransferase-like enzyme